MRSATISFRNEIVITPCESNRELQARLENKSERSDIPSSVNCQMLSAAPGISKVAGLQS